MKLTPQPSIGHLKVELRAMPHWRMLLEQSALFAENLARDKAGNSIAARIAIMAMTTSSSISVKPTAEAPPDAAVERLGVLRPKSSGLVTMATIAVGIDATLALPEVRVNPVPRRQRTWSIRRPKIGPAWRKRPLKIYIVPGDS